MGNVVAIHQKRYFTLGEVKELFPVIRRLTRIAHIRVKNLNIQLGYALSQGKRALLEQQIQSVFQQWQNKVSRLGCDAKGMWLVDFDNGEGYYCWHYPETDVFYFHGYLDGYRGRIKVN